VSLVDFFVQYGPGLGGVGFVVGFGLLFWWADRRREKRRVVAQAADTVAAAREFAALADALREDRVDVHAELARYRWPLLRLLRKRRALARNAAPG
jgi:hypothetical protein